MNAEELLAGCSNPELFGPNSNEEARLSFLKKVGLTRDPQHYFKSEKDFLKSGKYYGYIEGKEGLIIYRG